MRRPGWKILALAAIVLAAVIVVAVLVSGGGSKSNSNSGSSQTTTGAACAKGGSCGYENVTPAEAVVIIANQAPGGPGSISSCTPTNGSAGIAAMKGSHSSEWDCVNVQGGAVATYTINADGSVDY